MKIVVLDLDETQNKRLRGALSSEAKTEIVFCSSLNELIEALNGQENLEAKKNNLQKTLHDGKAMLARTIDAMEKAKKVIADKQLALSKMTAISQEQERLKATAELTQIQLALAKSEDLKRRLDIAIGAKEREINSVTAETLTEDQKKVNLVLVDRSHLGNLPSDWCVELRNRIQYAANKEVPVATMAYNEDLDYIKKTLHGGIVDYLVKPVDLLLLKHSLRKMVAGQGASDDKVFELATKTEIQMFKTATVVKMSEFEVTVQSDTNFREREIVEFFAENFTGAKGQKILGCCFKVEPDPAIKGWYLANFSFVGHTPHTMNEMRKWLRASYVQQKQNADS